MSANSSVERSIDAPPPSVLRRDDDAVFDAAGEDDIALHGWLGGDNEEAVVFAGVGAGECAGGVTAEAVGEEPFGVDGGIEITAGGSIERDCHIHLPEN